MINWSLFTLSGRYVHHNHGIKWDWSHIAVLWFWAALDCALLLAVSISCFIFIGWRVLDTPITPFACDDESIRNPLYKNTVQTVPLVLITLFGPTVFVIPGMFIAHGRLDKPTVVAITTYAVYLFMDYAVAYWLTTFLMEVIKASVGRLRPNFVAMCKPDKLYECDSNPTGIVSQYTCLSDFKYARNSRASFPSGHSGASVFALVFLFLFMTQHLFSKRIPSNKYLGLYRTFTLIVYFLFTVFCCYSRITDFWHFPTDVLGGVMCGTVGAFVSFHIFRKPKAGI